MNHEGYADQTAGAALTKISKEENMNAYVDEDIVRAMMASGYEADMVLLRCYGSYATAFKIVDSKPSENGYAVKSRAVGYIDTGRPQYVFLNNIQRLVRSMTEVEFTALKNEIRKTLNLGPAAEPKEESSGNSEHAHAEITDETIGKIADQVADRICKMKEMSDHGEHDDYVRAQAERDVYKNLFTSKIGGGEEK